MNKFMKKLGVLALGMITALGVGITGDKVERAAKAEAGSFTINIASFGTSSGSYADRVWTSTATTGETITGKCNMFFAASPNAGTIQTNSNTPMYRNEVEAPGAITKITIDSKTTRVFTIRVSETTSISSTSSGVAAGTGTLNVTGGTPGSVTLAGNYRYFYIQNASGATYVNSIKIEYEKASAEKTPEELAAEFDAKVAAAHAAGVTVNSKATVEALELEFAELEEEVKALVNTAQLTLLRTLYNEAVAAAAQGLADTFMAKVDALVGKVTATSGPAIAALESEYAGLDEAVKTLVDAMDYATIIAGLKLDLSIAIEAANQAAADIVILQISQLPEVLDLQLSDAALVAAARAAFNALTDEQELLVTNISKLIAAEARITELDPTASATVVYNKETKNLTWSATSYASSPLSLSDTTTLSGKTLRWLQNAGQLNGGIAYLGANSTNVAKMNIDGADYVGMKAALANVPDTNTRIAMLRMGNFYVNKPCEVKVSWSNANQTAKSYIAASTDSGVTWSIIMNNGAIVGGSSTAGSMTWSGLDYVGTDGVQFAAVFTYTADVTIRDVAVQIKALGEVTDVFAATVAVESITINPSSLSLDIGATSTLAVDVYPATANDKTYSLVSDNTDVATVDPVTRVVTAVGIGTANITATSTDGGKTSTCIVKVSALPELKSEFTGTVNGSLVDIGGLDFDLQLGGNHTYRGFIAGKGAQFGATSTSGEIIFRTKVARFTPEELEKIAINASNSGSSGNATLKVMVGDTQLGEEVTLTNVATDYVFESSALRALKMRAGGDELGRLEIIATGNGVCFNSIAVYGGAEAIAMAQSAGLQEFIGFLEDADTCNDYADAAFLRELFDALSEEEKELAHLQTYMADGGIEANLMEKLVYMEERAALMEEDIEQPSAPLLIAGNEDAITLIAIIAVVGLSAIGAYYFLNKKKYAA